MVWTTFLKELAQELARHILDIENSRLGIDQSCVQIMPLKGKRRTYYFWWECADIEKELKRPRPWKGRIDWKTTAWIWLLLALGGICILLLFIS